MEEPNLRPPDLKLSSNTTGGSLLKSNLFFTDFVIAFINY